MTKPFFLLLCGLMLAIPAHATSNSAMRYLSLPRWQRIGGTMAAQFCLLALLYYCFRFHCVHDCESRQTDSEN